MPSLGVAILQIKRRGTRRTKDEKYKYVIDILDKFNISFDKLLMIWSRADKLRTRTYQRRIDRIQKVLYRETFISARIIDSKLKSLISRKFFTNYDPDKSIAAIDLKEVDEIIQEYIPRQYKLLRYYLLPNQRYKQQAYNVQDRQGYFRKRIIALTSAVVYSKAVRNTLYIQKSLVILLMSRGCSRRFIEVLNNLGIVCSFRIVQRLIYLNTIAQIRAIKTIARDERIFKYYDNYCKQGSKKEQIVSQSNIQINVTIMYIARYNNMPLGSLKKSMLNYNTPLDTNTTLSLIYSKDSKAISLFFINQVIEYVFKPEVNNIFKECAKGIRPPQQPTNKPLGYKPLKKKLYILLIAVLEYDEATIEGTYSV